MYTHAHRVLWAAFGWREVGEMVGNIVTQQTIKSTYENRSFFALQLLYYVSILNRYVFEGNLHMITIHNMSICKLNFYMHGKLINILMFVNEFLRFNTINNSIIREPTYVVKNSETFDTLDAGQLGQAVLVRVQPKTF